MKQILHILTHLSYTQLDDPAWKMTQTAVENDCRAIVTFESKNGIV